MNMWEEIERLDSRAMERAESYTKKQLVNKYGDQTIKDLKDREYKIGVAKAVVASSVAILTPISIIVGLIATDPNVRKS
jgi:hypothetical protein